MKGPTRNSRPACARPDRTRVTTALPDGHSPIFSPERAPRQGHPGLCVSLPVSSRIEIATMLRGGCPADSVRVRWRWWLTQRIKSE